MHLKFDLYDINNKILISKNQEITESLISSLIKQGEKLSKNFVLLKDTPLLDNLTHIFDDTRYTPIFNSSSIQKQIINTLSKLKLEEPIVNELVSMKSMRPYTYQHVQIIAAMAITIISMMENTHYDPMLAAHLAITHDIGKTRINDEILNKETPLTNEEYEIIKSHPTIGYLLLNYYCGWEGKKYASAVYEHHEKLDGSGYPRGIKKIDPYAQLMTPIDIFDALISDRPYRRTPFTIRLAVDLLLDGVKNGQLNRDVVHTLINCLRKHKIEDTIRMKLAKERRDKLPIGSVYGMRDAKKELKKD
jgi:HD-GYP domain-containing protein (c-di-GMP phosphodiesterase class II)